MYEHEYKERKEPRDIVHTPMPDYAPNLNPMMFAYLHDRELDYDLARQNGWYPTRTRGPRVVIPCTNNAGFNYWQARAMDDNELRYDSPAVPRKDSIVLLWPPKKTFTVSKIVVITEGPMDALAAAEFYPSIAIMGGCPSGEVLDYMHRQSEILGFTKWLIIPDRDNISLVSLLYEEGRDFEVITPTNKDLAAMPRWEREKLLGGSV